MCYSSDESETEHKYLFAERGNDLSMEAGVRSIASFSSQV